MLKGGFTFQHLALEPDPLLQWEEGLGEEGPRMVDAAGTLLSLALSSQWRGDLRALDRERASGGSAP
jgi:hypothetical protein